jgi:hypothetical protein
MTSPVSAQSSKVNNHAKICAKIDTHAYASRSRRSRLPQTLISSIGPRSLRGSVTSVLDQELVPPSSASAAWGMLTSVVYGTVLTAAQKVTNSHPILLRCQRCVTANVCVLGAR